MTSGDGSLNNGAAKWKLGNRLNPNEISTRPGSIYNPSPPVTAEKMDFNNTFTTQKGPAGYDPRATIQFQFFKSRSPVGPSALDPANRVYQQSLSQKRTEAQRATVNRLGATQRQIRINEKTNSGTSRPVASQFNYTSDYFQLPTPISSFIQDGILSAAVIPYVVGGALALWIFWKK